MTILHGTQAIAAIEAAEKRKLSYPERRIVMLEGYADEPYRCSNDVLTCGVGQTGAWLDKTFLESFAHHVQRAAKRLPALGEYPEYLQAEIVQAEYRGDLGISPKACGHIKAHNWTAAAHEFLNHAEYKSPSCPAQIKRRIEAVHHALMLRSAQY